MCGIAGHVGNQEISNKILNNCLLSMEKRGPDSHGYKFFKFKNNLVSLIHSRLKIIDLRDIANQPMTINEFTIIFNGEIYNFKEIKKKLIEKGYTFKTNSDTEVLLKNFIDKKFNSFSELEGMWAIAIWDDKNKRLILSRDRFGQKPLCYYKQGSNFYFGSQINQITSLVNKSFEINYKKIFNHLSAGYRVLFKDDDTFSKKIKNFPPSHYAIIQDNKITLKKYWKLENKINEKIDYKTAKEKMIYLVNKSIKNCLISDQKISMMLSGGVDSNIIFHVMKNNYKLPFTACSVLDTNSNYDESKNINLAIKDFKGDHLVVDNSEIVKKNFLDEIKKRINFYSAPILTISSYVSSFLQEEISNNGLKVNISGIGADELFGGYYQHHIYFLNDMKKKKTFPEHFNLWKKNIYPIVRNPFLKKENLIFKKNFFLKSLINNQVNPDINIYFKKKQNFNFYEKPFSKQIMKNRMFNELFYENIPPMLFEDDRNHMLNSIENRSPFLDKDVVEFALSLPSEFLIKNGLGKYILRDSFKDKVNNDILFDKIKKGFNFSLSKIFRDKKTKSDIFDLFSMNKSFIRETFNFNHILKLFEKKELLNSESKFLFSLINVLILINNKTYGK